MTVGELRTVLEGHLGNVTIHVEWVGEEYDITLPSPARRAFEDFLVEQVVADAPNRFRIFLKQAYIKADGYEEV